jgi:hypothetical protein
MAVSFGGVLWVFAAMLFIFVEVLMTRSFKSKGVWRGVTLLVGPGGILLLNESGIVSFSDHYP